MTPEEIFWLANHGLPRQAPGSAETTRLLLRLVGPLPERPRIVDIGCGTGPSSVTLAAETGGTVLAIDTHRPFLDEVKALAHERVHAIDASMRDLPLRDGCADLVWAEGSAYIMGFDAALRGWRRLLAPGGALVLTEAEWTSADPAPGVRAFWDAGYPAMRTIGGNVGAAAAAGWTVMATYLLPDSDWASYYRPLASRIAELRREHPSDAAVLDDVEHEIHVREAYTRDYGYTAYVLRSR